MKQSILLLFFLLLFSSCRKDFAYFQKTQVLTYSHPKKNISVEKTITPLEPNLLVSIDDSPFFPNKLEIKSPSQGFENSKNNTWDNGRTKRKKRRSVSQKNGSFIDKIFPNSAKKHTKHKRSNPQLMSPTIATGFVILGIAILLALFALNSLSLLFGLASIVFLYLGFRRYFRKKNRRKIFR